MVAGSDRCVLRIFHQQLPLHIIDNGGREEDAHGALALGQQVQLFLFGHRSPPLASRQDDGLCALRDSELGA